MTEAKRVLLIVTGGIAAYKSLELVRLLKRQGIAVRAVMTQSATEFVTPLSMGVMTEDQVYGDMFDLKEEREIGHIQLSRQADLIVICPRYREYPCQDGGGDCGRFGDHDIARHRQARFGGARNERADVAASGDAAQSGAVEDRRYRGHGPR